MHCEQVWGYWSAAPRWPTELGMLLFCLCCLLVVSLFVRSIQLYSIQLYSIQLYTTDASVSYALFECFSVREWDLALMYSKASALWKNTVFLPTSWCGNRRCSGTTASPVFFLLACSFCLLSFLSLFLFHNYLLFLMWSSLPFCLSRLTCCCSSFLFVKVSFETSSKMYVISGIFFLFLSASIFLLKVIMEMTIGRDFRAVGFPILCIILMS